MVEDFSSQFSPFCSYAKDLSFFKHPIFTGAVNLNNMCRWFREKLMFQFYINKIVIIIAADLSDAWHGSF